MIAEGYGSAEGCESQGGAGDPVSSAQAQWHDSHTTAVSDSYGGGKIIKVFRPRCVRIIPSFPRGV